MDTSHVDALRQSNADLLKENTLLHAQKRQIIDAAEKGVKHAALEIDKLNARIARIQGIVFKVLDSEGIHQAIQRRIQDAVADELRTLG